MVSDLFNPEITFLKLSVVDLNVTLVMYCASYYTIIVELSYVSHSFCLEPIPILIYKVIFMM
jgi:hypothetical protein